MSSVGNLGNPEKDEVDPPGTKHCLIILTCFSLSLHSAPLNPLHPPLHQPFISVSPYPNHFYSVQKNTCCRSWPQIPPLLFLKLWGKKFISNRVCKKDVYIAMMLQVLVNPPLSLNTLKPWSCTLLSLPELAVAHCVHHLLPQKCHVLPQNSRSFISYSWSAGCTNLDWAW